MTGTASGAEALVLHAPAKLNLGLRLMGRRADGYHLLESIFAPIDLCDEVEIELLPGARQIELEVSMDRDAALPPALGGITSGPDNLAFRAATAFCEAHTLDARIRIRLRKAVPAAAGMGGGSSDAAAVLTGLSILAGTPLSDPELEGLAAGLGADVPFFLSSRPAHVSGIGEVIVPLDESPVGPLILANPGISLDTTEVYRAADALGSALTEPEAGSTMRAFSRLCGENGGLRDDFASAQSLWEALLVNDLEPAALRLCPPVGRLLAEMREAGAIGAAMTGSGATVFGVFESQADRARALDELRSTGNRAGASDRRSIEKNESEAVESAAVQGRWVRAADFL